MPGEALEDVFVAYTGVMGDRLYAISSSTAPPEFPWHTNREQETGLDRDKRRFRGNFYVGWNSAGGFYENELVNRRMMIGDRLEVMVRELEPRCKLITIDPETEESNPRISKHITRKHGGFAGVYAAVLTEGTVKPGDAIVLPD
jgi:hypothetical protein